jgi:hypothetical protein
MANADPSAAACMAVGSDGNRVLSEYWNGATWTLETVPTHGGDDGVLNGVSCVPGPTCTVVGEFVSNSFEPTTLAEAWSGRTWSTETITDPSAGGKLTAVSCTSDLGHLGRVRAMQSAQHKCRWLLAIPPRHVAGFRDPFVSILRADLRGLRCS